MADLVFVDEHTLDRMRRRQIPVDAIYHIVGDADAVLPRHDGR